MEYDGEALAGLTNLDGDWLSELGWDKESESCAPPSPKKRKTNANACKQCKVPDKYEPPSGHTKFGWCPTKQRYSEGAALSRLRDLRDAPESLDVRASAFLEHVRAGAFVEVQRGLQARPELMLMLVLAAPTRELAVNPHARPKWTWSILHEALRRCDRSHTADSSPIKTLHVLLDFCKALKIDVVRTIPKSSDTWSTPLHQACWRGSRLAIEALLQAPGADLFAETRDGTLPIHGTCRRQAPSYDDHSIIPWLIEKMIAQRGNEEAVQARLCNVLPEGFKAPACDVELLHHYCAPPPAASPPPRAVVAYRDFDDPANGDSLFL